MKILLDTCVFLWLASDAKELSDQAKMLFQDTDNSVYLSSVSVWEIVVKNKLGKLPLPDAPEQFINKQCEKHFIDNISLGKKAIFHLMELPDYHRDPFDRMLACQCAEENLAIISKDKVFNKYSIKRIW